MDGFKDGQSYLFVEVIFTVYFVHFVRAYNILEHLLLKWKKLVQNAYLSVFEPNLFSVPPS